MRDVFARLPPHIQQQIADLMEDPLYQRLARVASEYPPKNIILEHYIGLLHFKGNGNDMRSNISRSLSRHGVPKMQASLPKLFGKHEWLGLPLERPLDEDEVPPERRRGKAATFIIDAEAFLRFVVTADVGPDCLIGGMYGVEVVAHQTILDVIASQEPRPVDPQDFISYRHDSAMTSPNWHLFINESESVFAIMNVAQGAGPREREYVKNGFELFRKRRTLTNPCSTFNALRDQLRKQKVWSQKHLLLDGHRRVVFYLQNPRKSVWDHIDSSLFDPECQRWLKRVFKSISSCLGETSKAASTPAEDICVAHSDASQTKKASKSRKSRKSLKTSYKAASTPAEDICVAHSDASQTKKASKSRKSLKTSSKAASTPAEEEIVERPTTGGKQPKGVITDNMSRADINRIFSPQHQPCEWTTDYETLLPSTPLSQAISPHRSPVKSPHHSQAISPHHSQTISPHHIQASTSAPQRNRLTLKRKAASESEPAPVIHNDTPEQEPRTPSPK